MIMSEQKIDPIIIELSYKDPVVNAAISYALQNDMSEREFLIMLVEGLVNIKNTLNDDLINIKLNGIPPIIVKNNTTPVGL